MKNYILQLNAWVYYAKEVMSYGWMHLGINNSSRCHEQELIIEYHGKGEIYQLYSETMQLWWVKTCHVTSNRNSGY